MAPRGTGRDLVRRMTESISASYHMLRAPDAPAPMEEPAPVGTRQPGHETILVAEDEAVVREMVTAALERLGYRVVVASTGEVAYSFFRKSSTSETNAGNCLSSGSGGF